MSKAWHAAYTCPKTPLAARVPLAPRTRETPWLPADTAMAREAHDVEGPETPAWRSQNDDWRHTISLPLLRLHK
jgi:hypothetical protein